MNLKLLKIARFFHLINKKNYNEKRQIEIVKRSPLFDAKWYLSQNPDVKTKKIGAAKHYVKYGWKEGRNPSPDFDTEEYLHEYPELEEKNWCPLFHWEIEQKEQKLIGKIDKIKKKMIIPQLRMKNDRVIYTCITGGYDNLIEHNYQDLNWDYICFSDNEELIKKGKKGPWKILPLKFNKLDNVRNARWHKTHPHLLFPTYKYSIWIDGNIDVCGSFLFKRAEQCIKEHCILSVPEHPRRNCIYDEAITVKTLKKDYPEIIEREINKIRQTGFPKNYGLNETNIIFRIHNNKQCIKIMNEWFEWIEKYSRRDQLSFNFVAWKNNYKVPNFCNKNDVRLNPANFSIVKNQKHNGTIDLNKRYAVKSISIIIPVYNAIDDTKKCLESIERSKLSNNVEIIIVNDYSNKETGIFLKEYIKTREKYKLIENEQNLGFVKTCNKGMREAQGDIVILLNSDTMIPTRFEERILECFNSDDTIGIASPLASNSGLWDLPFVEGKNYEEMDKHVEITSEKKYPNILCPEGFCFCIRHEVINNIGYLDEVFGRGYCEETEYTLRALNVEWRIVLIDNLYVFHKRHASFGIEARKKQIETNKKILWDRWKWLYDRQMEYVKMSKLKEHINYLIYKKSGDHRIYKEKFEEKLLNFNKFPPVRVNNSQRKPSFNIFIPAINQNTLTAGSLGILYLGKFLWKNGYNVRFLLTEVKTFEVNALRQSAGLESMVDNVEFEYIADRENTVLLNDRDVCVATLWNTAYIAQYFQSFCKNKKFIYMIQDYETIFYPNSSISALIDATYNMSYNALFSTEILKEFFYKENIGNIQNTQSETFDTAALANLPPYEEFKNNRHTKRCFVFYGRPNRDRNMYDFGLYLIQQAIEKGILKEYMWDFYSVGAKEKVIKLSNRVKMQALPYMSVGEYKKWITTADLGLSLMLSPHPSMVPIDLSLSGAIVVTNTYKNKDERILQNICENILAGKPEIDSLLQKIKQAVSLVDQHEKRYNNAKEAKYCNSYDNMFGERHLAWLTKLYPDLK